MDKGTRYFCALLTRRFYLCLRKIEGLVPEDRNIGDICYAVTVIRWRTFLRYFSLDFSKT